MEDDENLWKFMQAHIGDDDEEMKKFRAFASQQLASTERKYALNERAHRQN